MNLDESHLTLYHGEAAGIAHQRFADLVERNFKPEYRDIRTVESESEEKAYLVAKVETLTKSFEDADVLADRTTIYLCSCPQHYYRDCDGLETNENPENIGKCKHIRREFREEKAKDDPDQTELKS